MTELVLGAGFESRVELVLSAAAESIFASISYPSVLAMAILAFFIATGVGVLYQLMMDGTAPWHVPVIVGVGAVGLWMNTADTIVQFMEQTVAQEPLLLQNMATNSSAILAAAVSALLGGRIGDGLAPNVRALSGATETEREVNRVVRTIGRFITVTLPKESEIDDIEWYEPVPDDTKGAFAGVEFLFPRGLTVEELHGRIVERLRSDYGVGYVDLELDEDGTITHLGVGSRAAGIGPTLPPRQGAVAVEATPPPEASPGDRVHVWASDDGEPRRIGRAELRAADDGLVTLIADVRLMDALEQSATYDLVTLPSTTRPELEFASLLRAANETMDAVTIDQGSPLAGIPVGGLAMPVVAIRDPDRTIHTAPPREHRCGAGSTVYVIGRPDDLRKFRVAASAIGSATEPSVPARN